jgi:hypothetical protein
MPGGIAVTKAGHMPTFKEHLFWWGDRYQAKEQSQLRVRKGRKEGRKEGEREGRREEGRKVRRKEGRKRKSWV